MRRQYRLSSTWAERSGERVEQRRTSIKLVGDLGSDNNVCTVALMAGGGICLGCGAESKARTGVLEGMSFGPRLLGVTSEYFYDNRTGASMARLSESVWKKEVPDNTALVKVTVLDALVWQRNVRHQMAKNGRERFSAPVSFSHTCELNGAWQCMAVREICLDPPWIIFETWFPPARMCALTRCRGARPIRRPETMQKSVALAPGIRLPTAVGCGAQSGLWEPA